MEVNDMKTSVSLPSHPALPKVEYSTKSRKIMIELAVSINYEDYKPNVLCKNLEILSVRKNKLKSSSQNLLIKKAYLPIIARKPIIWSLNKEKNTVTK